MNTQTNTSKKDLLFIINQVNIKGKDYSFLYTFDAFHYSTLFGESSNQDTSKNVDVNPQPTQQYPFYPQPNANNPLIPYNQYLYPQKKSQFNKKYKDLPSSIENRSDVKQYIRELFLKEYKRKYLYVPSVKEAFPVSRFKIEHLHETNNQKLLRKKPTSIERMLFSEFGRTMFEFMNPSQTIYIAEVKFYVRQKHRVLQDSFDEFCLYHKEKFQESLNSFQAYRDKVKNEEKRKELLEKFKQQRKQRKLRRRKNKTKKSVKIGGQRTRRKVIIL